MGVLYIADTGDHRIVKGTPSTPLALSATPAASVYAVEDATDLGGGGQWLLVPGLSRVSASSGVATWADTSAHPPARYYRAIQLP